MDLWLGLAAWILPISYTGMGHIVNERGHILNFSGAYAPPHIKRPRIRRELIEIYRLVGSDRETEVGIPPNNLPCSGPDQFLSPRIYNHIYNHIYIHIYLWEKLLGFGLTSQQDHRFLGGGTDLCFAV